MRTGGGGGGGVRSSSAGRDDSTLSLQGGEGSSSDGEEDEVEEGEEPAARLQHYLDDCHFQWPKFFFLHTAPLCLQAVQAGPSSLCIPGTALALFPPYHCACKRLRQGPFPSASLALRKPCYLHITAEALANNLWGIVALLPKTGRQRKAKAAKKAARSKQQNDSKRMKHRKGGRM
eukprot:1156385-Pelagomonas_calceolata.AAC.1